MHFYFNAFILKNLSGALSYSLLVKFSGIKYLFLKKSGNKIIRKVGRTITISNFNTIEGMKIEDKI